MLPEQVPVDAAYAAALDRLNRMTQALVLSEGARLVLAERVKQLEALTKEQRAALQTYWDAEQHRGEVTRDAENGEAADAGGEAHPAQDFHD
jgi:hypothetical protein